MAQDWNQVLKEAHNNFTTAFENNSDGNPIYIGRALPGNLKGETGWQIKKLTWSSTNLTDLQWPNGSDAFEFVWDDRASYSYS